MIATILDRRSVLKVEHATLVSGRKKSGEYTHANFELFSGQMALVRFQKLDQVSAFADACTGLSKPVEGSVGFLGRDWRNLSADAANVLRGRIGRVFSSGDWLEDFKVAENILLCQRHHTSRPAEALGSEAALLAVKFGLPGLPTGYPQDYSREDLRRAACVRAFLGKPALVLLEDPTFGLYPHVMASLINAIRRARDRGAAVIWMTLSSDVWQDVSIPADIHLQLSGHNLKMIGG